MCLPSIVILREARTAHPTPVIPSEARSALPTPVILSEARSALPTPVILSEARRTESKGLWVPGVADLRDHPNRSDCISEILRLRAPDGALRSG